MANRITQLLTRIIALAFIAVAGFFAGESGLSESDTAAIGEYAGVIAAGIVAVVMIVIDLLIHRAGTGSIFAKPGDKKGGAS